MSYTLEQKREALAKGELWWRFPDERNPIDKEWSLCLSRGCDESLEAEYHIGPTAPTAPTPPRVLSELEGELLEALKAVLPYLTDGEDAGDEAAQLAPIARAAIQKAEAQQ